VGLFGRRRQQASGTRAERTADPADVAHLERFVATRSGVEAYLEPATLMTAPTVILIGHDGEWTRRRLDPRAALAFGHRLGIPVYDVRKLGYPQRMRDYNARQRARQG